MNVAIRITVLVENSVHRKDLKTEHDLACLVKIGERVR